MHSQLAIGQFDSPVGRLGLIAGRNGLLSVSFTNGLESEIERVCTAARRDTGRGRHKAWQVLNQAFEELAEYLCSARENFQTPLDLSSGTEFQRAVWRQVKRIKHGRTRSYSEIAEAIGRPRSVRAVGNAVGSNPLPLFIPCHRVLAANGLGGFGGGLELKKKLLNLEGAGTDPQE